MSYGFYMMLCHLRFLCHIMILAVKGSYVIFCHLFLAFLCHLMTHLERHFLTLQKDMPVYKSWQHSYVVIS